MILHFVIKTCNFIIIQVKLDLFSIQQIIFFESF